MFKQFTKFALCLAMGAAMTACGGDDDKSTIGGGEVPTPEGEMEQMTPTESKKFLDQTASEFLGKFRAADQRELIELASWVGEEYEDLDLPSNFEIEADGRANPATYVRTLLTAMAKGNASRAGSAAITYTYSINFERFAGIYEPGTRSWVKTESSNDIIFRFKNKSGQACELKATAGGNSYEVNVDVNDRDYVYDWTNDSWEETEWTDSYKVTIPGQMTVTLTAGGSQLASTTVISNLNRKSHTFNADVTVEAANLKAVVNTDGNDRTVTANAAFYVSGDCILASAAQVNGSRLCDFDNYQKLIDDDDWTDDDILAIVKDGSATATVLNKVSVDANINLNREVINSLDGYWDYDCGSKEAARLAAEKAAETLNDNVKAYVRYNNTVTQQASIVFKPYLDQWGSGNWSWEYVMDALLRFEADNTTYSFEEFFESGFGNVSTLWDDLLDNYEKVWDAARR